MNHPQPLSQNAGREPGADSPAPDRRGKAAAGLVAAAAIVDDPHPGIAADDLAAACRLISRHNRPGNYLWHRAQRLLAALPDESADHA